MSSNPRPVFDFVNTLVLLLRTPLPCLVAVLLAYTTLDCVFAAYGFVVTQ